MHEPRLWPNMFGQVGEEGQHVMLGHPLDLVDALDLEPAALPHRFGGALRDNTQLRLSIAGVRLDLEPDLELGLGLPDADHFGPAVTWDHERAASMQSRVFACIARGPLSESSTHGADQPDELPGPSRGRHRRRTRLRPRHHNPHGGDPHRDCNPLATAHLPRVAHADIRAQCLSRRTSQMTPPSP